MGLYKKTKAKIDAKVHAVKANVGRKWNWVKYLFYDSGSRISEMREALRHEPETVSFEEMSRRWRVDPFSDAPDRAARINLGMAIVYIALGVWCVVQLAAGLAEGRTIASIGSGIAFFASSTVGVASLWRHQIFSQRKYIPFFRWCKQGGSLYVGLLLAGVIAASSLTPDASQAKQSIDIDLPTSVEIQKDGDLTAMLMRNVFGETWTTIAGSKGAKIEGYTNTLQGLVTSVLGSLNLAALTYLSILIMYMWGIFAVSTAHEGKKLGGGVYNSMWVPARHALSFSLTVPALKGLSLLQCAIIACISLSINFANAIADPSLKYLSDYGGGSVITSVDNTLVNEARDLLPMMFRASVVQELDKNTGGYDDPNKLRGFWTDQIPKTDNEKVLFADMHYVVRAENGTLTLYARAPEFMDKTRLGSVSYMYPKGGSDDSALKLQRKVAEARIDAAKTMWKGVRKMAFKYLTTPNATRNSGPGTLCSGTLEMRPAIPSGEVLTCIPKPVSAPEYTELVTEYARSIREAIKDTTQQYIAENKDLQKKIKKSTDYDGTSGSKNGWATIGLWSFSIGAAQSVIDETVLGRVEYKTVVSKDLGHALVPYQLEDGNSMLPYWGADFVSAYKDSGVYFADTIMKDQYYSATSQSNTDGGNGVEGLVERAVAKMVMSETTSGTYGEVQQQGLLASVMQYFGTHDPLVVVQSFGDRLLISGLSYFGVGSLASLGGAMSLGTFGGAGSVLSGGVLTLAILKITGGVLLKYVAPILPLLFWMKALLTWTVLVIESVVAAPFWACVHALPKGEGFAGDAAKKGYLLLIDIVIRPPLLVTAVVISWSLSRSVSYICYILFNIWFSTTSSYIEYGLIGNLVYSFVVVVFFYVVSMKLYTKFIIHIPAKISHWIGGAENSGLGGEDEAGAQSHRQISMVHGQIGNAATMTLNRAGGAGGGQKKIPGGGGGDDNKGGGDLPKHIAPKGGGGGGGSSMGSGPDSVAGAGKSAQKGSESLGAQISARDGSEGNRTSQAGSKSEGGNQQIASSSSKTAGSSAGLDELADSGSIIPDKTGNAQIAEQTAGQAGKTSA